MKEILTDLEEAKWHTVGQAVAYESLSKLFRTEAGVSYSIGHDDEAEILREWSKRIKLMGEAERQRQKLLEENITKKLKENK